MQDHAHARVQDQQDQLLVEIHTHGIRVMPEYDQRLGLPPRDEAVERATFL